jgi:serine/threonine protein kinase
VERLAAYGEPVEGTPFGRYRLVELLGRGGMGEVWRAHDTAANNRTVAIKLPPQLAADHTFVQRFRREADAAAQLNNPHIIPIHNYGFPSTTTAKFDGRLYVDMRLVEGRDLQEVLADGPLEAARAVRIIEQVAKALHAAHEVGLLHRDVKPSNILLDRHDFAYLIDFGIARALDETRLTKTGNTIGTFHYMAPERLRDQPSDDARADIYALAVLTALWTAESPCVTAVAQCRDGAAHAVAVCAGPGASRAATARRRGAGGLESASRRADPTAKRPERRGPGDTAAGDAFAGPDERIATPGRRPE